jgi:hypothetical protein
MDEEYYEPIKKHRCLDCDTWTAQDICPNCGSNIAKYLKAQQTGMIMFGWIVIISVVGMIVMFLLTN